jgi:hypothetical protein
LDTYVGRLVCKGSGRVVCKRKERGVVLLFFDGSLKAGGRREWERGV